MPIFKINKTKVLQISLKENGFNSEADLRDFFVENLEELLGVRFLAKEYSINYGDESFRIDTLGIDENDSPVIIEYKWQENEQVLTQGECYLSWLMDNKPHFNLLCKDKLKKEIEVDWNQPRVILIAKGFDRYTLVAVKQKNNIELKTYAYYKENLLQIENIYTPSEITAVQDRQNRRRQRTETQYNIDYHLQRTSIGMQEKFQELRTKISELPKAQEFIGITGIWYRTTKSFVHFDFRPEWLQVLVRNSSYPIDNYKIVEDITDWKVGYKGRIQLRNKSDINYIFEIVKQSYESTL